MNKNLQTPGHTQSQVKFRLPSRAQALAEGSLMRAMTNCDGNLYKIWFQAKAYMRFREGVEGLGHVLCLQKVCNGQCVHSVEEIGMQAWGQVAQSRTAWSLKMPLT